MGSTDSRNSEDNIYDVLRTDILNLKLRPGMIFSIRDISEAYQVGRTPVRDALISLSKEGLITFLPQRGTMISKINYDKVLNERFLRTCVEEKVILEFMAVCDLKAITELEMSLDRQEKFVEEEDIRAFLAEDMYFHSIFYVGVNKGYCNDIISANSGRSHSPRRRSSGRCLLHILAIRNFLISRKSGSSSQSCSYAIS